jgi:anti-sigma regulatory factor (Ser/Thr protein kinase)
MSASLEARLQVRPDAAAIARDALLQLEDVLGPRLLEDLRLVTSELVTNAVRHGGCGSDLLLRVDARATPVLVEVEDGGPGFVPVYPPRPGELSGWGLCLVDRLADRWGVAVTGIGTRVWAELPGRRTVHGFGGSVAQRG